MSKRIRHSRKSTGKIKGILLKDIPMKELKLCKYPTKYLVGIDGEANYALAKTYKFEETRATVIWEISISSSSSQRIVLKARWCLQDRDLNSFRKEIYIDGDLEYIPTGAWFFVNSKDLKKVIKYNNFTDHRGH